MALKETVRQVRAQLERAGHGVEAAQAWLLRRILERQLAASGGSPRDVPGFFAAADFPAPSVERLLDAPDLDWSDATALGWAYQFWNDDDREAIDRRIGPRGRVQVAELASKTQLFTERYMVDWLARHSVGRLGHVPLESLRVLDPACGTGHLLVGVFDFLVARYQARGDLPSHEIVRRVLTCNLHGIDIDPLAVRITAAALYLRAQQVAPGTLLPPLQLVASVFDAANAPEGVGAALAELSWRGTLTRRADVSPELHAFLHERTSTTDLGVQMHPAPVPAGARLYGLLEDASYHVVISNPPYLATAKIALEAGDLTRAFDGMPDLFAAFTRRSLELCLPRGLIAFVALSNWMFLSSFAPVRELLLRGQIVLLADLGKGAFRHASKLIQTAMVVASPTRLSDVVARGARVGSRDEIAADQPARIAAELRQADRFHDFDPAAFTQVEGAPFLFWIDQELLGRYAALPKIEDVARGAGGIATGDNERFVRSVWEVAPATAKAAVAGRAETHVPYLKGAAGREWIEPCRTLLRLSNPGEFGLARPHLRAVAPTELGVAYTTIGQRFAARLHSTCSVRDVSGASFFPGEGVTAADLVCALNRKAVRELACALNPTINFQLGDVRRLPFDRVENAAEIVATLQREFERDEQGDELSVRFRDVSCQSAWGAAKAWAQRQVDRPRGAPLEPFDEAPEPRAAVRRISHALGQAFGRFGRDGLLDRPPPGTVAWFVADEAGLQAPCFAALHAAWTPQPGHDDLPGYLRHAFFAVHRRQYENRPIYLPLSSRRRSVVVWVAVHRFYPGLLGDVAAELGSRPGCAELDELLATLHLVAKAGPPAPRAGAAGREVDAPFELDLDDGILPNAAALWPLLDPQWKDPKRWWGELAAPAGKRDYDWSRVAGRYFPGRIRAKCIEDASLSVAHRQAPGAPRDSAVARLRGARILEP